MKNLFLFSLKKEMRDWQGSILNSLMEVDNK